MKSSNYITVSSKRREQTKINGYIFHESVLWKNIRTSIGAMNHNLTFRHHASPILGQAFHYLIFA